MITVYDVNDEVIKKIYDERSKGGTVILDDTLFTKKTINGQIIKDKDPKCTLKINKPADNFDFSTIKNVHFLKGTYFDRDYFRRLYPEVNVRNKPDLADVIIYDDKSLFTNENKPLSYYDVFNNQKLIISNVPNPLHTYIRSCIPNSYENRYYGNAFKLGNSNTQLVQNIISALNNGKIKHVDIVEYNPYFDKINGLNKPVIKTDDIYKYMPSKNVESNMSYTTCLALMRQLVSTNLESRKTAAETLIQYSADKYFPIQTLGLLMANLSNCPPSHKINLYTQSYMPNTYNTRNLSVGYHYAVYGNRNQPTDDKLSLDSFFNLLSSWASLVKGRIVANSHLNFDFELTKQVIYSYEFIDIFVNKVKLDSNSLLKIRSINWEIDIPELSQTIYIADTKQPAASIDEFSL
jgi:hypothetical protein